MPLEKLNVIYGFVVNAQQVVCWALDEDIITAEDLKDFFHINQNIGRDAIINTIAEKYMIECWNEVLLGCDEENNPMTAFLEKKIGKEWNLYEYPCCSQLNETTFVVGKQIKQIPISKFFNSVLLVKDISDIPESDIDEALNNKLFLKHPDIILMPSKDSCFFH